MKITQSKTKDLLATITVNISLNDYNEKVEKILKDYKKTSVIPGFRKGKTPMSIINKKYRTSVLVDQVNKLVQDELYKHITTKKLRVLGSPMPIEDNKIDWEKDEEFILKYKVGLAPDFEINISTKDKIDYFVIKADKKLVDSYCKDVARRYGEMKHPEISEKGDLILCSIHQVDEKGDLLNDGIKNEATVSLDFISDKKILNKFIGIKKEKSVIVNVIKAFKNHADLSSMLNISKDELNNLTSTDFQFTVKNINRLTPAKYDKDLFDKVYGKDNVKNEKDFRKKIKEDAENQFIGESDRMLKNDVVTYMLDKLKLSLPDQFLKHWLLKTSEKPLTVELIDKEYDMYSKSLKWQLIENKILEQYNIKVTNEDSLSYTKQLVAMQMKQYGQPEAEDKQLADIANNILKNEEEKKKIYNQLFDQKTLKIYKENFKLNKKSITYDDFIKLASEKNKKM